MRMNTDDCMYVYIYDDDDDDDDDVCQTTCCFHDSHIVSQSSIMVYLHVMLMKLQYANLNKSCKWYAWHALQIFMDTSMCCD